MDGDSSTRRHFIGACAGGLALSAVRRPLRAQSHDQTGRLTARPQDSAASAPPGLHKLELRPDRDALLYIPESSRRFGLAPLLISLHGAGRGAARGIEVFRSLSDEHGFLLLSPASAGVTWDLIENSYGPDVASINQSLERTFTMRGIDPVRIAMAGFSDGASYSLALGLRNGDLFSGVLAFSPGYLAEEDRIGKPSVFLAHGKLDTVFPIETCGRRIFRELEQESYRVTFREFDDGHMLPPQIASEAMRWFMRLRA